MSKGQSLFTKKDILVLFKAWGQHAEETKNPETRKISLAVCVKAECFLSRN